MGIETFDDSTAIEVADGIFHLGVQDSENSFSNIPYLIVGGDEAAIIDPGSAKPEFFEVVLRKIKSVIDLKKIRHIIVQHQDPDLCAAIPLLEPLISPDYDIRAPLEAAVLVQHYNLGKNIIPLDDDDTFVFENGRTLTFAMTPYCHFIGSMVIYDPQTRTLFSSDVFGGFSSGDELYAHEYYPLQMEIFLGEYLGSKRALEYALKRLEQIVAASGIDLICPQHGCLIPGERVAEYLTAAHNLFVGGQISTLASRHNIILEQEA